ncbi:MAG: cellulase family glycosylhydrolase [Ignavibacteriae bacterium]|nr:cellulase family glycosylhydrolase [Ignavibacteriota bacterium]
MKKHLNICYLLFFLLIVSAYSQNHKYELWKTPSFFRGFNLLPGSNLKLIDYQDLKATGANLAQLGIDGFDYVDPPYEVNTDAITATDSMVKHCKTVGLYYTLTVRSGPGRRDVYFESVGEPKSTIWKNATEQEKYAQMLKEIVERYKDDSLFVGIGLIVEPNPLFENILLLNAKMMKDALDKDSIDFKAINQLFIDKIRNADTTIPIIIQNFKYSCPEFFAIVDTFSDKYYLYEFHSYRPIGYASNNTPNSVTYPGKFISINDLTEIYFDKNVLKKNVFYFVDSIQKATGKPIFLGEFGILYEQGGGPLFLNDMYEICMEEGWHFAIWDFRSDRGSDAWDYEKKSPEYWQTVLNMFKITGAEDNQYIVRDNIVIYPNPAVNYIH